jgi:death on curing protein
VIEQIKYLNLADALIIHLGLMKRFGEIRYGVDHLDLIESALARPQQAAVYENADLIRQAATLYFGLIKNHPWLGGNKRTATVLVDEFLYLNEFEVKETIEETINLVLAIEADEFGIEEIENWLRARVFPTQK